MIEYCTFETADEIAALRDRAAALVADVSNNRNVPEDVICLARLLLAQLEAVAAEAQAGAERFRTMGLAELGSFTEARRLINEDLGHAR